MDFTPLRSVNDLHRNEFNALPRRREGKKLFRFYLELIGSELHSFKSLKAQQAETTLAIGKVHPRQ